MTRQPEIAWILRAIDTDRDPDRPLDRKVHRVMTPRLVPDLLRAALDRGLHVIGHPAVRTQLSGARLDLFTPAATLNELEQALRVTDRPVVDDYLSSLMLGRPPGAWMNRAGALLLPNRMTLHTDNAEQARFDLYGWYGVLLTRDAITRLLRDATAASLIGEDGYTGDTAEREDLLDLLYRQRLPHLPAVTDNRFMPDLKATLLIQGELDTLREPD